MDKLEANRTSAQERTAPAPSWMAALPGFLFVATFTVGMLLWTLPNDTDSDATWVSWLGDRGHRFQLLIGGYLLVFAAGALATFLMFLYRRVYVEGRDPLIVIAIAGASIFVALGGLLEATTAGATIFGSQGVGSNADLIRFELNLGIPVEIVGAMLAIGWSIGLLTLRARRVGYVGTPMSVFGIAAVVACVLGVFFLPAVIMLAWALTVSVIMARRPVAVGIADGTPTAMVAGMPSVIAEAPSGETRAQVGTAAGMTANSDPG